MALSAVSINRMTRDIKEMTQGPPAGISAWATGNTISRCQAQIIGPEGTPYMGGVFQLRITFPDRYPMEPPNVKFVTKVYHPNVSKEDGNICCSVLNMPPKGDWKPAHSLRTVLLSIQSLLAEPNPADPLDADAARELTSHPQLFHSRAAEWTRLYASPDAQRSGYGASTSVAAPAEKAQPPAAAGSVGMTQVQEPLVEVQGQARTQAAGTSSAALPAPLLGKQPQPASYATAAIEALSSAAPAADGVTSAGSGGGNAAMPSNTPAGQDAQAGSTPVGRTAIDGAVEGGLPPSTAAVGAQQQPVAKPAAQGGFAVAAGAVESKRPPEPTSRLSKLSKRPRA